MPGMMNTMILDRFARYKFEKSIPGAMKSMNFISRILENHTWHDECSDFGSIWMIFGVDGDAFCIGFHVVFVKKLVC